VAEPAVINSLLDDVERVSTKKVKVFPGNPRVGNIDAIAESLAENGQFRPIVVQRSTGHILGGNHTYLAARKLGWTHVDVVYVDVDDMAARRIVLSDNKTSDMGEYNNDLLAALMRELPDSTGTGYSDEEFSALIEQAAELAASTTPDDEPVTGDLQDADLDAPKRPEFNEAEFGDEDATGDELSAREKAELEAQGVDIDKAQDTLAGGYDLKPELELGKPDFVGYWGIPRLRTDMLVTPDEMPEKLVAWAGSASRDTPHNEDPDGWWLYNYGVDSTSGMKDVSRCIPAFWTWDEYFENWWHYPERFVAKVLNSKIKYIVSPDFSPDEDGSRVNSLWALYRNRYLARYFQESGLKVVYNVQWPDGDKGFLKDIVLATLPVKDMPLIALQAQTIDSKKVRGGFDGLKEQYQLILDTIRPEMVLLYASDLGHQLFTDCDTHGAVIKHVAPRTVALAEKAKQRTRKTTL
jgi:hypothetical protein